MKVELMNLQPNVALAASLLAEPALAAILMTLTDGRARPAEYSGLA